QKVRFRQCGQYNRGVISPEIDDTIGKDNRLSPSISRFSFDNESTFRFRFWYSGIRFIINSDSMIGE
ncbi:hypothetical protein, partial [Halonotius terrestris]|uniref:hypothetical protein n=1 Tax=Halonotius terrestris TaxID=2487750 RepID=UPI001C8E1C1C